MAETSEHDNKPVGCIWRGEISGLHKRLLASQEGLYAMDLLKHSQTYYFERLICLPYDAIFL